MKKALKELQSVAFIGKLSPRNLQDRVSSSRVTNVPCHSRIFEGRKDEIADSTKSRFQRGRQNYEITLCSYLVITRTSGGVCRKCRSTRGTNRPHLSLLLIKLHAKPISAYKL